MKLCFDVYFDVYRLRLTHIILNFHSACFLLPETILHSFSAKAISFSAIYLEVVSHCRDEVRPQNGFWGQRDGSGLTEDLHFAPRTHIRWLSSCTPAPGNPASSLVSTNTRTHMRIYTRFRACTHVHAWAHTHTQINK